MSESATLTTPAVMSGHIEEVRRLVQAREVLRPGFSAIWPRLSRRGAREIDAWSAATLELSRVHAGPTAISAFWAAAGIVPPDGFSVVVDAGWKVAAICREAGSRAAVACLETLPEAVRLCGSEPQHLAGWWWGLHRLGLEAPLLVASTARSVSRLLADGDALAFADFVAAGLKATARSKPQRVAFFALESPLAQSMLDRRATGAGFADVETMLDGYVSALWDSAGPLRAAASTVRRTVIAEGVVLLPPSFAGVPAARQRALYRAAAAHAEAHLIYGAQRFAVLQLKPLQLALIGLIEDARVETLAIQRFPGLRPLWAGFHEAQPTGANTCVNLMARLARALLNPDFVDPNGFVQKGVALFRAASGRYNEPLISREIGGLLGNDLGQLRLQFNAKTYVVEPTYRCDNMHLWDFAEAQNDALATDVEAARGANDNDGGETPEPDDSDAPRARDAGVDERGTLLARYPEWDQAAGVERPDWTSLWDATPRLLALDRLGSEDAAMRARMARLVGSMVVGRSVRQHFAEDGEQLDLDAAVRFRTTQRRGELPDPRVYYDRQPRGRDLSTLIILDVSQSTSAIVSDGRSILSAEIEAVQALASGLDARGDRYALRAFASAGRDDVRLTRVKDFDEPHSDLVTQRLAGLQSGLSTRLGAALRHAGAELAPLRTTRKLVLVLTDGEPSDIDVADPCELVEDARRAVLGLRLAGIDVFGIVMDPAGVGSASTIFGGHNAMPVRRLEELPAKLAGVYFRLAQR